jgi:hypothetical protein
LLLATPVVDFGGRRLLLLLLLLLSLLLFLIWLLYDFDYLAGGDFLQILGQLEHLRGR